VLPASDARGADLRGAQGEPGSIPRSSDGSGQTAPISMAAQRRRELKAMIRLMQDGSRDRVVQSGDLYQWKRNSINRADLLGDVGSFTNEQRKAIETFVELELALPRDWLGENGWGVGAGAAGRVATGIYNLARAALTDPRLASRISGRWPRASQT
jgi:hypothetical protein